jgi:hypothetical protein
MTPALQLFLKRRYFVQHLADPSIIMKVLVEMIGPLVNRLAVHVHLPRPFIHPFELFELFWLVELAEINPTTLATNRSGHR